MPKKRKRNHKRNNNVIELIKGKPRGEEEKFFIKFSETQMTAVLLIILASTFLVQAIVKYFEFVGQMELVRPWFLLVFLSLIFLVLSIVLLTLGGIVFSLRLKRTMNLVTFGAYIIGFTFFLVALLFLLIKI